MIFYVADFNRKQTVLAALDMLVFKAQHGRNARTVNVDIEQPYPIPRHHQRRGQIYGDSALAYTALAGQDCDFVLNPAQPGLEFAAIFEFFIAFIFHAGGRRAILVAAGAAGLFCCCSLPSRPHVLRLACRLFQCSPLCFFPPCSCPAPIRQ